MNTVARPLTFRRESFGGIAFSPHDGTLLELDGDGYEALLRAARGEEIPDRGFARGFLNSQELELGGFRHASGPRALRIFENARETPFPFSVYSAPTLVDFQITTRCDEGCPHCYVSALPKGEDVSLPDALHALRAFAEAGVCQVALGGGEPLLHPHFSEILQTVREHGMVPNVTTTGRHLDAPRLDLIREHCGAAALSLEAVGERFAKRRRRGFSAFLEALDKLQDAGIPSVLQVTVGADNLDDLESIVNFALTRDLYGVVFLAYKPVGRGEAFDAPLSLVPMARSRDTLARAFRRLSRHTRVGYDCCLAPLVAGFPDPVYGEKNHGLEGCSAVRGSVGVSHELDVIPCTFFPQWKLGNLHEKPLLDIWRGAASEGFRERMRSHCEGLPQCRSCDLLKQCAGGCPLLPLVPCARNSSGS